jgi:hypothetical protein
MEEYHPVPELYPLRVAQQLNIATGGHPNVFERKGEPGAGGLSDFCSEGSRSPSMAGLGLGWIFSKPTGCLEK